MPSVATPALDLSKIWLHELDLSGHAISYLAKRSLYVVSDVATWDAGEPTLTVETGGIVGASVLDRVRVFARDAEHLQRALDARSGSILDPAGPALGVAFRKLVSDISEAPEEIPIGLIRMRASTATLFRKARILSLADVLGMTNLDLIRALRPRTPELLDELWTGVNHFLAYPRPVEKGKSEAAFVLTGDPVVDGIETLHRTIAALSDSEQGVLSARYGFGGDPLTLEETGRSRGVSRERIRQIEAKAMGRLAPARRFLSPFLQRCEQLRAEVGMPWSDARVLSFVSARLGPDSGLSVGQLRLIVNLCPPGECIVVQDVEEAAVAILAHGPMETFAFEREIDSYLDPWELSENPGFRPLSRLTLTETISVQSNGSVVLTDKAIGLPGAKRIMRLQAMHRVLEEHGPSHFRFVADALRSVLPEQCAMDERTVHAWLSRYTGIFVWAGLGCYGLKGQEVGIRSEQAAIAGDDHEQRWRKRRKGIGDEIAAYLMEFGPAPLAKVEDHILDRFAVQQNSVSAAIYQDSLGRFAIDGGKVVSLRPEQVEKFYMEPQSA